eukprot:EG_transcript_13720
MEALLSQLLSADPLGRDPSPDALGRDFSSDWDGERLALQEIYGVDFQPFNGRDNVFRIQVINGEACAKRQLWLYFVVPVEYPARPCIVEVEPNFLLSRKQTDMMYALLADEATRRVGMPMIFNLCIEAVSLLDTLQQSGDDAALLMLAARGVGDAEFCSMFVDVDLWPSGDSDATSSGGPDPPLRLFTATQFTGPVANILARLHPVRVLHVEPVMRHDLAMRFDQKQLEFFQKYGTQMRGTRQDANREELSAIQVAFHGTSARNVQNIVREGLVVPREATGVAVASGSRYGLGIYLSPNAGFSIRYCHGGNKLLVCAVLLGKAWTCTGVEYGVPVARPGFDSHISPCGNEWVLFSEAQVLPCFVIHYASAAPPPVAACDRPEWLAALGRKRLPFGFGPAGEDFEVLEVAPTDDEEDAWKLNEYQDNVTE